MVVLVCVAGCGRLGFDALGRANDGGDDSPSGDSDGDGVADGVDNCPGVANPDQADEDSDALGDACDPCPPFAGNTDTDGDGVPDQCDPNPASPGDSVVVFDGFNIAPPGTVEVDGSWTFTGGRATVTSSLNALAAVTYVPPSGTKFSVFSVGTIDAMFGNGVARPVGVVQEFQLATSNGIMCVFGIDPSNSQVFALADNATTTALTNEPAIASVGTTSTFRFKQVGTTYTCEGSNAAMPLTAVSNLAVTPNRIGVFTRSASAHFDWVMIVKTQ